MSQGGWNQGPAGGAPPGGWNPGGGAPPPNAVAPIPGSLPLGFCAGLFGGCIGLIAVLILAKGPATKRGAGFGFAAQFGLGVLAAVVRGLMHHG